MLFNNSFFTGGNSGQYHTTVSYTMEPLLWDTSIQGQLYSGGCKIWSWKNFHNMFVSVTSIEGITSIQGKGTLFLGPKA